jgi:hypothetical protein
MRGGKLNDPRFGFRMRGEGEYAEAIERLFTTTAKRLGLLRDERMEGTEREGDGEREGGKGERERQGKRERESAREADGEREGEGNGEKGGQLRLFE